MFVLLAGLFLDTDLYAQRRKLDSLFGILPQRKDSGRVKVYLNLANAYKRVNLDSAIFYGKLSLTEARKLKHLKYEYNAVYKLGDYYREKGEFKASLSYLDESLQIGIRTLDSIGMAQTYNSIGNTYNKMGDFTKAIETFLKSLKIKEKFGDKDGMANTYVNIGNIYSGMSIYDKAEEYILKGIKLKQEVGDKHGAAGALNNLSIIYSSTNRVVRAIKALESILKEYGDDVEPFLHSAVLGNLAEAYQKTGQLGKSIIAAKECLKIRQDIGDSIEVSYSLITLANIESENKNYPDAILHAQQGLRMGEKTGMLSRVWDAHISMGETYASMGEYKKSVEEYRQVIQLSDTLINSRAFTIIHEMDAKYESDKKEAEISKLNSQKKINELELERQEANISRQRWIMFFGALLFLCMVGVSVIVYKSYKQKKRSNEKLQSAYNLIEEKQKEILDSIYYARRIQSSLFTSQKFIEKTLSRLKNREENKV